MSGWPHDEHDHGSCWSSHASTSAIAVASAPRCRARGSSIGANAHQVFVSAAILARLFAIYRRAYIDAPLLGLGVRFGILMGVVFDALQGGIIEYATFRMPFIVRSEELPALGRVERARLDDQRLP